MIEMKMKVLIMILICNVCNIINNDIINNNNEMIILMKY